jgi:ubiquitin-protein ligase
LSILLAGPENTPYASGLFRLDLRMEPGQYPAVPPTANFHTKIFHPNVDPSSGAVCVDTLKRDWKPELTLRDVLVTISCLLVCPNPASALNAEAGHLMEDDFAAFERMAGLWAKMHAAIPVSLSHAVEEAKRRVVGEKPKEKPRRRRNLFDAPASIEQVDVASNKRTHAAATPSEPFQDRGLHNSRSAGLGLDVDYAMDSSMMEIDTPTQNPLRRPARKRYAMNPPAKTTPDLSSTPSFSSIVSMTTPPELEPPSKRRRTHSPPVTPVVSTMLTECIVEVAEQLTAEPSTSTEAAPWIQWISSIPARSAKEVESLAILHKAARFDSERFNRGRFGPRRGIFRL